MYSTERLGRLQTFFFGWAGKQAPAKRPRRTSLLRALAGGLAGLSEMRVTPSAWSGTGERLDRLSRDR